ncbi:MAG: ATP-dependent Clp protease adapter ClpS [Victivallaceae bacterium]|nr:ATP-dependent Clp protease adapter ClpS [Victivallaceae bacterium]
MHQVKETVLRKNVQEQQEPSRYKVLLLNDDYTTMDFVIMVLMVIFHKSLKEARQIMLHVHRNGKGLCGIYAFEVAETKAAQVSVMAEQHKFPLKCALEEE